MDFEASARASTGVSSIAQLYGFSGSAANFAIRHIQTLQNADNVLANRCGQVLEAAMVGFGVGGETALVLIGAGQALLGNPLTGAAVAPLASNPIVMTCAAIGAIHYGWKAMNEKERQAFLGTVSAAFDVGVEFIRSILHFAVEKIRSLMSRNNFAELKKLVRSGAALFGRHLSDVTRALSDRLADGARYCSGAATGAASTVLSYVPGRSSAASTKSVISRRLEHED